MGLFELRFVNSGSCDVNVSICSNLQVFKTQSSSVQFCSRKLLDTVKARKLAYYGHTMRKQGSCLEKEI